MTTPASRYSRTPNINPGQTPAPGVNDVQQDGTSDGAAELADMSTLIQRMEQLKERRMRRAMELERANKEIEECRTEAAALGVSTLEDLEALVSRQKQEDDAAKLAFARALDEEQALLDGIDQRMAEHQEH